MIVLVAIIYISAFYCLSCCNDTDMYTAYLWIIRGLNFKDALLDSRWHKFTKSAKC